MFGFGQRAKVEQINGTQLDALKKNSTLKIQFIDVRTAGEIGSNKIKGFKNIPLQDLKLRINELDQERPVVLLCATGSRSFMAGRILAKAGFSTLYNLQKGLSSL